MISNDSFNKSIICVFLLTFTLGCTTIQPLATTSPQALVDLVAVGDTVVVERKNGDSLELTVTEVSKEGVGGSGVFVPYADIQQLSRSRENFVGTALLVILGVTALVALENNSACGLFTRKSSAECSE
jgi:hypothetical protein